MMCTSECVLAGPLTQCVVPPLHSDGHAADFRDPAEGYRERELTLLYLQETREKGLMHTASM